MGTDWQKLQMQTAGNQAQNVIGSQFNPDLMTTAMLGGYRPNMYGSPMQQMQNMQQFMALQKNMMDSMMGGPNGVYAKQSPGNPMAGMPANYQAYFNSMAPLFSDPLMSPTMPGGGPAAGGPNGYQFGPVSSNMSPLMAGYLQSLAQGQSTAKPDTSQYPALTGGAGTALPGGGAGTVNAAPGGSNMTVNTSGGPLPKTMAMLAQNGGLNAIPQGTDPYNYLDNILSQYLQSQGGGQGQQGGGSQGGGINPLALILQHMP
jgi:hypothetical protein